MDVCDTMAKASAPTKLHPLITKAVNALPPKAPQALKDFTEVLFQRTSKDDLEMMDPKNMALAAQLHFDMMNARKVGKPDIRITNPTIKKDGWAPGCTVIDIVNDDMAFLVDSVTAEITHQAQIITLLVHPVIQVRRNASGKVTSVSATPDDTTQGQSHIHIHLNRTLSDAQIKTLHERLEQILVDTRFATGDWQKMRSKLRDCENALSHAPAHFADDAVEDYQGFLEYLYKDNFTLLGYREYAYAKDKNGKMVAKAVPGSHLGLLRTEVKTNIFPEGRETLPQHLAELHKNDEPLLVFKIHRKSTVHRRVNMDAIMVRLYDKGGKIKGEALFVGLFTSVTYSRSIRDIPYLSRKTHMVTDRSHFASGSHNHKALAHILEKYPRDELFQIDVDTLYDYALSMLRLQKRQRIALYTRLDTFSRYVSCLVYVPRELYDTTLRMRMQSILEDRLNGTCDDYYASLDDSPLARVMYVITIDPKKKPTFDRLAIEHELQEAGRSWAERLNVAFAEKLHEDAEIAHLTEKYGRAFPSAYRETYIPKSCVHDVFKIEEALSTGILARDLYRSHGLPDNELRLKLYRADKPVILSDILPMLENMGLRVIAELPFEVRPHGTDTAIWIHDFQMETTGTAMAIDKINTPFEEALIRIWNRETEDDSLNRLVVSAAMNWREVTILRTYVRYMRQAGVTYSNRFLERALTDYPVIARLLVDLFMAHLNPAQNKNGQKDGDATLDKINKAIEKELNAVKSLDQDKILRSFATMINATLRTNFFQKGADGQPKPYLSIKLDSGQIADLPDPKPFREIFVYSVRMEGIHLRGDRIARGGIRWSDRPEDFRTEVLGLMKAQQVKNAIIVPMGAKGGFVVKNPPTTGGREAFMAEGIECYKMLIRGMLDITDNLKGHKVVPPKDVVRRDGDDPYIVAAADKGTATFSDLANSLSAEYGFWLGDAFASGGSAGYDHKKMGITARGAWESVKRHFRELGTNIQETPFDVIGVGDMGGDVFGNGMLLSPYIRLIGAFNHVHIFCDPNPDIAKSFAERKRLFDAVKGWDGYDEKLLSKGGRIYSRADKSLKLTPEIMAQYGIEKSEVSPPDLIRAMLKKQVDLLWFGGIGTYVKAPHETHADVGDKANDALRVNTSDIRARVIGEGANLGVTQAARNDLARRGIRLNADFIDNSGGVNSSDVEVNIKILMTAVMHDEANTMTLAKRNTLLASMTDEVANLVLRNNYQQTQGISLMVHRASDTFTTDVQFIRDLERDHGLNRALEHLPDEEEIERRRSTGMGLLRPELCTLQSYAKIMFTRELLDSDVPDEKATHIWLSDYFPAALRKKFDAEIRKHRLKREIVATAIANGVVNRLGATFVKSKMDSTSASAADVARSYIIVREIFGLRDMWDAIEALDNKVPAEIQTSMLADLAYMADHSVTWMLTRLGRRPNIDADIASFTPRVKALRDAVEDIATPAMLETMKARMEGLKASGVPASLARNIAMIPVLDSACDIIRITLDGKTDPIQTAKAYFEAGEHFHIDWLRQRADEIEVRDRWTHEARGGLIERLFSVQAAITLRILKDSAKANAKKGAKDSLLQQWLAQHADKAEQITPLLATLQQGGAVDIPRLMIAEQRLSHLASAAD